MLNDNEIKMREEFEAWVKNATEAHATQYPGMRPEDVVLTAWNAWQAAYRPKQVEEDWSVFKRETEGSWIANCSETEQRPVLNLPPTDNTHEIPKQMGDEMVQKVADAISGTGKAGKLGDNFSESERDKWIIKAKAAIAAMQLQPSAKESNENS